MRVSTTCPCGDYLNSSSNLINKALIIGGGIGGLTSALALSRIGQICSVFEQASIFSEIGAGVQLGPNATRRLHALGLESDLAQIAAFPAVLQIYNADNGAALGSLSLGTRTIQRYGAPYITVHRADLHAILLRAVQNTTTELRTESTFKHYSTDENTVQISTNLTTLDDGAYVIGADGLHSRVRQQLLLNTEDKGIIRATGHKVYRSLISQNTLPMRLRNQNITVWLGAHCHCVSYPVRGGELLNVAVIVQDKLNTDANLDTTNWNQTINSATVRSNLTNVCVPLTDLIHALPEWRAWRVYDRPALCAATQMAQGRIALLGDAAHPMRPYLAQGAGMAIEDATALAEAIDINHFKIPQALKHYAQIRWQRCAQVQTRAQRNGNIFHATGLMRLARNAGMSLLGQHLLDIPWLYSG